MEIYEKLLLLAKQASENSYSPYSKFSVGSAVLFESGEIYKGSNIENASYGLSLCAERCAMATALAQGEKTKIKAIAIYSPNQEKCLPCGACRQWLLEFAGDKVDVILESKDSKPLVITLNDIFPYGFKFEK